MILYTPMNVWWCCLHPRERNMITLLIAAYITNPAYILRTAYDLLIFVTGRAAFINMNAQFEITYGLTPGTILDPDGVPIDVVFFDELQWPVFLAFSLTPEFICAAQCKLFTFPL